MSIKKVPRTILVDQHLWNDCKAIAKDNDSDISKEIRKFLKKYRAKNQAKTI